MSNWKKANPELVKAYNREYHRNHKAHLCRKARERYRELGGYMTRKAYRQKLKAEIINLYGGVCCACGFSDLAGLSIDHANGDGYRERESLEGYKFYEHLRKEWRAGRKRADLRVLCMTCQFMAREYGSDTSLWPKPDAAVRVALSWAADGPVVSDSDYKRKTVRA